MRSRVILDDRIPYLSQHSSGFARVCTRGQCKHACPRVGSGRIAMPSARRMPTQEPRRACHAPAGQPFPVYVLAGRLVQRRKIFGIQIV